MGTAIGTRELRRNVGTFELCIASALSEELVPLGRQPPSALYQLRYRQLD